METENRSAAIFAITQLMELISRLPMKFFPQEENRYQILESMQTRLDDLIVSEEQEQNEVSGNEVVDGEEGEAETTDLTNITENA
jgi:low affinity Fe/Cu permease